MFHRRCAIAPLVLLAGSAAISAAQMPAGSTPDPALDAYARPANLVDIGGRKLNLRCSGSGTPTVMLESGATTDSLTWFKVQPPLARATTVCSYDRAGYGFSDDGPRPRDIDADAADLHALIHAAQA